MNPTHLDATREAWITQVAEWTVGEVKTAIWNHESGTFHDSALLAESLDRNPRISAALDTRCKGVVGLPFSLEPADDSEKAQAFVDLLAPLWWDLFPEALLGETLRWIVTTGLMPAEMTARADAKTKLWFPVLHPWHLSNVWWDDTAATLRTYTMRGDQLAITPGDGWWVCFAAGVTRPWMRGVVRCLGIDDTVRGLAVTDWAKWSERHGIPIALAKIPHDQFTSPAGKAFRSDVRTMGSKGVVGLPTAEKDAAQWGLSFLEPGSQSWEGFQQLIAHADKDIAIAILGQSLTTEVSVGSLAAAQVHELVRQDYIKADARVLETTLREQVLKPFMVWNWGPEAAGLAPWPKWDTRRPGEMLQQATTLKAIGDAIANVKNASPRVDVVALLEQFQIPLMSEDEADKEEAEEPKPEPEPEAEE